MSFQIIKKDSKTRARLGVLTTPHGVVHTPSYVIVATRAFIKALEPEDIKKAKTQIVISNTYHLADRVLKGNKSGRIKDWVHRQLGVKMPIMTDSGGFQVFSLGAAKEHRVGKVLKQPIHKTAQQSMVKISEKGVTFKVDGIKKFLSPEISMDLQEKIGADMIFAFDECTSPLHPFKYNKQAMERTHRWALRCLKAHKRKDQILFGIVQGGLYKSLRVKSAKVIGALPFGGIGIGGSFGKDEMAKTLEMVVPHLPEEKPRHLLGIGQIRDIFVAVENGMDLFDCVIPSREGRHGRIYTDHGPIDVRQGRYAKDKRKLRASKNNFGYLHKLFKAKDLEAGRLGTMHNISFFNDLLSQIRQAISRGQFAAFKKSYLTNIK